MPELPFVHKGTRGKYRFDFRCGNGAGQPFNTGGVVHHRRNAPAGDGAKNHRGADTGVRQHQADFLTLCRVFVENTSDKQCLGQQLTVSVRGEINVFYAVLACAVTILCGKEGVE